MGNDILTSIIAVEQEIQQRLAAEDEAATQALNQLRCELEEDVKREGDRLATSVQQAVAAARTQAQEGDDATVQRATLRAQQLDSIDDETLKRCILKHLSLITREQAQ